MPLHFEVAGGSVAGWDHRTGVPKNRQDDFYVLSSPEIVTAIVADGCGTGNRSEVGASLAVRLLNASLHRYLSDGRPCDQVMLRRVRQDLVSHLNVLANAMGSSLSEVVTNYFLFTILGVAITTDETVFFGLGDGVIAINGEVATLQPEAGNRPIYLGYTLTGSTLTDADPSTLDLKLLGTLPTAELASFLIGTDGASDISARADTGLPGLDEVIGPLSQFWSEDRFFTRVGIERRLNLIARDWSRKLPGGQHVSDGGKLPDDTTIVVGRNLDFPATPHS